MHDLLPPDPNDLELLHTRDYEVRSFRMADDRLLLRGAVRDKKPAGLYVVDDPDPLTIHHMVVELEVSFPAMTIEAARVVFETHPHDGCPRIVDHYEKLVGLSIARGFTHKVREHFGGPRGCTHTTALLQAMAPVAVQSTWSLRNRPGSNTQSVRAPQRMTLEQRRQLFAHNLNTCHVWDEHGEHVAAIESGNVVRPIWVVDRLRALGRDPEEWFGAVQPQD